jgi:hypothetical protein
MSKKWWGGGAVTSLGLLLSVAFLPDWLRTYLAILFLIATIILASDFYSPRIVRAKTMAQRRRFLVTT